MAVRWWGRSLWRDQRGLTFVEFALIVPFLLVLFCGGVEVARYILIHQKLSRLADSTADMITQGQTISRTQIDQILAASNDLMSPLSFATSDAVVFTSIEKTGNNNPVIRWQYPDPASKGKVSLVGNVGQTPNLPNQLVLVDKENIIIAEVFYRYQPIAPLNILTARDLYKTTYYKPRLGSLSTLN